MLKLYQKMAGIRMRLTMMNVKKLKEEIHIKEGTRIQGATMSKGIRRAPPRHGNRHLFG